MCGENDRGAGAMGNREWTMAKWGVVAASKLRFLPIRRMGGTEYHHAPRGENSDVNAGLHEVARQLYRHTTPPLSSSPARKTTAGGGGTPTLPTNPPRHRRSHRGRHRPRLHLRHRRREDPRHRLHHPRSRHIHLHHRRHNHRRLRLLHHQ